MLHTALQIASIDTGVNNAKTLLLQLVGVAILVVGVGVIWAAKSGAFADVLGTVAIVAIGLTIVVLGLGFATAGKEVGETVLAFFGF